ncbi:hypothetical protein P409_10585 [Inquilinus limosus MP06]|uniref:Uncharacterized protein n=1 Tax=Inquilinus limosus MP06 TaxID=1398085 RepID=A0A0A0DBN8_9PROT|nr:hypothetical protein P409_10585 [Inquilinus limosus MP06]
MTQASHLILQSQLFLFQPDDLDLVGLGAMDRLFQCAIQGGVLCPKRFDTLCNGHLSLLY